MAMLVEPSRSGPAWPLLTTDVPAVPREIPAAAVSSRAHRAGNHGVGGYGAGAQGAGAPRPNEPYGAGHQVGASGTAASPLRAAVLAACSKPHVDPGFPEWLREVVRNLDNPAI